MGGWGGEGLADANPKVIPRVIAGYGGGEGGEGACANWEACVRDYLKTCL